MHDSGTMRLLQTIEYVDGDFQKVGNTQCASRQALCKRLALQILHHQKIGTILITDIVQRANVRMIKSGDDAGFAFEALF